MGDFKITPFLLALLLVVAVNSKPELRATEHKLIKINEHDRTKNILILKNSEISSLGDGDHDGQEHEQEHDEHDSSTTEDSNGSSTSSSHDDEDSSSTSSSAGGGGGGSHGVSVDGGCVNPHPAPLHIFAKFAKTLVTHRMFVLSASQHYADQASLVLTGKPISENDPAQACLRIIFENHRRRLQGFGQKSLLSCSYDDVTDITCYRKENRDASLKITYVWSDGRSTVLAIMCANGRGSWAILSNVREIEKDTREAILQVVEQYGFDPEDKVDFSWTEDDCAATVGSQYNEGPCAEDDDHLETIPANKKEAVLRILHSGVYTPFSSLANAYATGMFIRGTPLKSKEELDQVCVKDVWSRSGEVERQGFHHQDNFLECDLKDFARISCIPNEDKAGHGTNNVVYNKRVHPVWTDGKKYVLTYNCLSTHLKTWALYSTSNEPLAHDTKEFILAKVADYGFNPSKFYEANYEHCAH